MCLSSPILLYQINASDIICIWPTTGIPNGSEEILEGWPKKKKKRLKLEEMESQNQKKEKVSRQIGWTGDQSSKG